MRVQELKPGTKFRCLRTVYVLQSCSPCAALVEIEAEPREVVIDGKAAFTAPVVKRVYIGPTTEVDEVLGTVELKARTTPRIFVNQFEEAEKAIARQERKDRAKAKEVA